MKKVHVDILQFRGSHYDFGLFQGKLLQENKYLLQNWQHFHEKNAR